ncbi:Aurachin C monooxygenase/isomerase [Thalictrum thalictroides]|uniref:Aurachin C monooxygenase/isomerase n=1 Tax=Thalictrum thalictroides TaxID=46969 RepID=A0A7J6W4Y1_THATH|nr:Aurachin C monooxygenase/isomerase [Thalictrum thalictroides]
MKAKAIVVGGSIGGVSCAHALIRAGLDVIVIEKTCAAPSVSSLTGAGLGIDPQAHKYIQSWLSQPQLLNKSTLPLTIDLNQATDSERKISWTLTRDENFNFRAAHWADLHSLLYGALPPNIFLWGHLFLSFSISDDKTCVKVKAKVLHTDEIIEITSDLLIGADGCLSAIRKYFMPDHKLRYSGYYAWRGILDFSGTENSDTIMGLRTAYPELGKCLVFDLVPGSHVVLYELKNKRINWIWYVNSEEPEIKGKSVTMKVSRDMIEKMHKEAYKIWVPELARVMKETEEPFINVIYDCDPLEQVVWDNVVLIGDAAHPTTPHGVRSTNMSILDAVVLGECLEKWGSGNLVSALKEFQSIRLPVVTKQVLHSRRMGRIKQGLPLPDRKTFDPMVASPDECLELQHKNMPFFSNAPVLADHV